MAEAFQKITDIEKLELHLGLDSIELHSSADTEGLCVLAECPYERYPDEVVEYNAGILKLTPQMVRALKAAECYLADPEMAEQKGYGQEARDLVFAVMGQIRRA